jgi:hypothetical protein
MFLNSTPVRFCTAPPRHLSDDAQRRAKMTGTRDTSAVVSRVQVRSD